MSGNFDRFSDHEVLRTRKLSSLSMQKTSYLQGSRSTTHFHNNARLVFVLRGTFSEVYERKARRCSPFMGIFRPPQEKHSEDYYGRGITCLSADIDPEWIAELGDHDIRLDRSIARQSIELTAFVARLNEEFDRSDKVSALAIEALMLEIAIEIASPDRKFHLKNDAPKWLSHATEYIHAEFTSALTVAGIANAVGIHPVHLTRVFRRFYNQSIPEYIQRLRVEHACRLMTVPEISLAEISAASGFSDQSHFCKTFKRIIKTKPADYRAAVAAS